MKLCYKDFPFKTIAIFAAAIWTYQATPIKSSGCGLYEVVQLAHRNSYVHQHVRDPALCENRYYRGLCVTADRPWLQWALSAGPGRTRCKPHNLWPRGIGAKSRLIGDEA